MRKQEKKKQKKQLLLLFRNPPLSTSPPLHRPTTRKDIPSSDLDGGFSFPSHPWSGSRSIKCIRIMRRRSRPKSRGHPRDCARLAIRLTPPRHLNCCRRFSNRHRTIGDGRMQGGLHSQQQPTTNKDHHDALSFNFNDEILSTPANSSPSIPSDQPSPKPPLI